MEHLGKEVIIEVNGRKYRLSRFTRRIANEFLDWADKYLGSPLARAKEHIKDFPEHLQAIIVKDALELARMRRSITSPEIQNLLATPEGSTRLFYLLFKDHQPTMTEAEVDNVCNDYTVENGLEGLGVLFSVAAGRMPKPESEAEKEALQSMGALPSSEEKKTIVSDR